MVVLWSQVLLQPAHVDAAEHDQAGQAHAQADGEETSTRLEERYRHPASVHSRPPAQEAGESIGSSMRPE